MVARKLTQDHIDAIPAKYAAGQSSYAISREFGVSGACIRQHVRRGGELVRPHGKLVAYVDIIPDRYTAGASTVELAREMGVTKAAVRYRLVVGGVSRRSGSEARRAFDRKKSEKGA